MQEELSPAATHAAQNLLKEMACVWLCLNISHLQSNLMNYSDGAIYCVLSPKTSALPACLLGLTLCPATGSF